ncbi:MAG: type IV secretory system conjugative DNA transfer family protein, partial [Hyphomicrobiaceae bacterium]|nr:type IV secretory system conjugative DNA transfer family protein [Hyphomicrobiaceae bacterium]
MAASFKEALRADLPRGLPGKENAAVSAAWGEVWALGEKFPYGRDTPNGRRGVFLGYDGNGVDGLPVGFTDDRHVMTIAGSRGGKGRSLIVPNMLMYEGSVLTIDPKGELARITSRARAEMGQRVFVLDPFGASLEGCKTDEQRAALQARLGHYNPLSELDPTAPTFVDDAAIIASALIKDSRSNDRFWTDSAKVLVHALILYVFTLPEDDRNLCTVRDLLTLKGPIIERAVKGFEMTNPQAALWRLLSSKGDAFEGIIAAAGNTFGTMHDNGVSSVLATARTETAFLDSPTLRDTLRRSDFKLGELKRGAVTLYLCLPAGRMASHANWLRIFIDLAMHAFEKDIKPAEVPLLMVLDEFPVLGYMRSLEAAAGQIAGFGVKLWTIIQDITQLKRLYRDSWETFIANSGVVTAFANTDGSTLQYLSGQLGKITMDLVKESGASAAQQRAGANLTQKQVREDPLLAPHEIALAFERDKLRILVMVAGLPPLALQRARYDKDPNFQ